MPLICGNCNKSVEDHAPEWDQCNCRLILKSNENIGVSNPMTAEEYIEENYSKAEDQEAVKTIALHALEIKEREFQDKLREIKNKIWEAYGQEARYDMQSKMYEAIQILDKHLDDKK